MNNKTSFADFYSFFGSFSERTIENLATVYDDKSSLLLYVQKLFDAHKDSLDIKDKKVLLKPNWVKEDHAKFDSICLRTNNNLLLCVIESVLAYKPSAILVGDAPVQGCNWELMLSNEMHESILELSRRYNVPITIKDFRRTTLDLECNQLQKDKRSLDEFVIFDVGEKSWLEPISKNDNKFRVTCYDPDKMALVHHKGTHKYCVIKDIFDYDVVITVPKLKTHRMAGMTNSLKILVGINGDKDYLPHHRVGSISEGGDNYNKQSLFRTISNKFIDIANKHMGTAFNIYMTKMASVLWKLSKPDSATIMNAGWYGNDTIWRTVLDLNMIALYGDSNGVIHEEPQRKLYTFVDAIISGQGDGPLHPEPVPLGIIGFSDNSYLMDVVAGHLYHIEHKFVPLLREAEAIIESEDYHIRMNDKEITLQDIENYGLDIRMSPGWVNYKNR